MSCKQNFKSGYNNKICYQKLIRSDVKFICDHMLVRLGRWLRAAGYDTIIVQGHLSDTEIYEMALNENRFLITRDTGFIEKGSSLVIWLEANKIEDCIRELSSKININWLKAPFSRCLECNHLLEDASSSEIQSLPQDVQATGKHIMKCSPCNKFYWLGSHTERMFNQLKKWEEKGNLRSS